MIAVLSAVWSRVAGYVAIVGAVLAALGWAYLRGGSHARDAARRAALDQDLDNRRTRDAVDRAVAARPDPAADLLRDWRRR